ncbi:hypothetical protein L873DRAFT_1898681 [Choiromyces venosus 120613-1]|uniref:Uncharacterized protein n=1 Tax=Choiromyces venosus 120613-1 TaxID=1336337 RepID=A0A3N4K4Z5_9PEZI|nr:hypothetical protein L873DRAFT_1898681 [Choiromyces venosus 120613-1]
MNLTSRRKNTLPMRPGYFRNTDNPNMTIAQTMILPDGQLKGLQIILQECTLWPVRRKFLT